MAMRREPRRAYLTFRLPFARLICVMAVVGVPEAWVVRCNGCRCIITAFATDPQAEHLNSKEPSPPYKGAVHVTCSCCWSVYRYLEDAIFRGQPQQSEQCKRNGRQNKSDGALLVAASTIAAIRLRGEPVKPSPKLKSVLVDSVSLARLVLAEIQK